MAGCRVCGAAEAWTIRPTPGDKAGPADSLQEGRIERLPVKQAALLYWAERLCCLGAAAAKSSSSVEDAMETLRPLVEGGACALERGFAERPARDTVQTLFERSVSANGPKPLIIFDDGSSLSYSEAGALAMEIAGRLQAMGVGRGDCVASVSRASAEAALVFWASALAGAVFVPVDCSAPPDRIAGILERVGPKAVFAGPECKGVKAAPGGIDAVSYGAGEDGFGAEGLKPFSAWLEEGRGGFCKQPVSPGDDAVVLFTSGTSGDPKGVALSHGALCGSGRLMAGTYGWGPDDRIFSTGDFHTVSGLRNPCVAPLYTGSSFITAPERSRANAIAVSVLMGKLGATILCTVPVLLTQFTAFREKIPRGFAEGLKFVTCTGSSLPEAAAAEFEALYGKPVLNYYGLTETSGFCIGVPPGMDKKYRGTIGVQLGCVAKIVAPGGGEAGEGEAGELAICSENVMSGYYGAPESTEKKLADGWCWTADLCRKRPDGSIEILGRMDDAFKDHRGELVHPLEIELALEKSALVLEAAVCGFDAGDGRPGMAAFIVPREKGGDEKRLASELRRHSLAVLGAYRTPAVIRLVDSLPRGTNGNGKILRRRLREALE